MEWVRRGSSWVGGGFGSERMELGSEGFKSGVGVEVIRRVGVEAIGVGVREVWVEGSGWDQGGRRGWVRGVGLESGGVGVGRIGVREVGIRGLGVGGDLGSNKESGSGGLMTFSNFLNPNSLNFNFPNPNPPDLNSPPTQTLLIPIFLANPNPPDPNP